MTQEQFEALGIEKSLAKKAADESKKELEGSDCGKIELGFRRER